MGVKQERKKKNKKHLSIKKRENVILRRAHTSTLISSFSLTGVPPRGHHHYIWTHLFPSPPPSRHWGCNLVPPAEAETSLINPLVFNRGWLCASITALKAVALGIVSVTLYFFRVALFQCALNYGNIWSMVHNKNCTSVKILWLNEVNLKYKAATVSKPNSYICTLALTQCTLYTRSMAQWKYTVLCLTICCNVSNEYSFSACVCKCKKWYSHLSVILWIHSYLDYFQVVSPFMLLSRSCDSFPFVFRRLRWGVFNNLATAIQLFSWFPIYFLFYGLLKGVLTCSAL